MGNEAKKRSENERLLDPRHLAIPPAAVAVLLATWLAIFACGASGFGLRGQSRRFQDLPTGSLCNDLHTPSEEPDCETVRIEQKSSGHNLAKQVPGGACFLSHQIHGEASSHYLSEPSSPGPPAVIMRKIVQASRHRLLNHEIQLVRHQESYPKIRRRACGQLQFPASSANKPCW